MKRIAVIVMLLPVVALSQPSVTGSSGIYSSGETITISGIGFGGGPTVLVFDDFEAGADGVEPDVGDATYGTWGRKVVSGAIYCDDTNSISGDLSLRFDTAASYNTSLIATLGGTYEVFASWWFMCAGTAWPENSIDVNWKSMWLWGDHEYGSFGGTDLTIPVLGSPPGSPPVAYIGANRSTFNLAPGGPSPGAAWSSSQWALNQWRRCSVHVKQDAGLDTGSLVFWTSSGGYAWTKTIDYYDELALVGEMYYELAINGYTRHNVNAHPTWDDVYIAVGDNAAAHIEIGNNQSYTSCTNLAILVPATWSDTEITATMRTPQFVNDDTAYIFVVDSDGNYSNPGYAITIAGK